jgi:hypothetical protein
VLEAEGSYRVIYATGVWAFPGRSSWVTEPAFNVKSVSGGKNEEGHLARCPDPDAQGWR